MKLRIFEGSQFPPDVKQRILWSLLYAPIEQRGDEDMEACLKIMKGGGDLPADLYDFAMNIGGNPEKLTFCFDDSQVTYFQKLQSFLPHSANTQFVQSVMNQMKDKRKLSYKQFINLYTILTTGKSSYNSGSLSTKN